MPDQTNPEQLPADPALAKFAAQAAAFDAPEGTTDQAGQAEQGQPAPSPLEQSTAAARLLLVAAREVFCLFLDVESPRRELTDAKVATCAAAIGKADAETGGRLAKLAAADSPWIEAAFVCGPILAPVIAGCYRELKARRPIDAQAKPAGQGGPTPAPAPVQ